MVGMADGSTDEGRRAFPGTRTCRGRTLFPYDYAGAVTIAAGDRVEVLGELETTADGAQGHGYRASAALLTPVGVPVLRVKRGADDAHVRDATDAEASADARRSK
jgi:hypothetical protein